MDEANPSSPPPLVGHPRNPVSTLRVAVILLGGMVLGTLVGMVVTYRAPHIYEARARVEGAEHQGHEQEITRFRAEMVTRSNDLENKWVTTFDGAAEKVRKMVHLESDPRGVTIRVRYLDPRDAQVIASDVAFSLDTPAYEKELASKGIRILPEMADEREKRRDIATLRSLLEDQAVEAGFQGTWADVLLGPGEDPILIELVKKEDFARRLAMLRELAVEIGYYGPPGEPIRIPTGSVTVEGMPMKPVSPNVVVWLNSFRLLGLALAGLLILALLRWKPAKLRPRPRAPRPAIPKKQVATENDDPW